MSSPEAFKPGSLPVLGLTLGDPAGCGPWVSVRAAQRLSRTGRCRPLLIGDASFLIERVGVRARRVSSPEEAAGPGVAILDVPSPGLGALRLGRPNKAGAEAAVKAVERAVALAAAGRLAAFVTAPVSKESFHMAGLPFPGHTELLAHMAKTGRAEMLMAAGPLLALLVTRHLPLSHVSKALTVKIISDSVALTDAWLRRRTAFRRGARWVMCGLNPHAGDNGLLGGEEKRVVGPAVRRLRARGVRVEGPLPADTAWAKHAAGEYDVAACLYHDQALIPLKLSRPMATVNVTAGLPWIRTSPGHGTAFDLARSRVPFADASPEATIEAARWALKLAGATSMKREAA